MRLSGRLGPVMLGALSLAWGATFFLAAAGRAAAGPYTESGIENTSSSIVDWASGYVDLVRGPMDIRNPGGGNASYGSPDNVVGPASCSYADVVSLGDGGRITMTFDPPITNGPGADFAVFENSFYSGSSGLFAELAFVEVSSDGVQFARFPSVSLTPQPVDTYGTLDPTNVYNLAGKHPGANITPCQGTPFDLAELASHPLVTSGKVNLEQIRYVRIVDVVGNGSTYDSAVPAHPVYDPFPTAFSQGGFDLQAVAVLHAYQGTGCFIATAAYGSAWDGKVQVLRTFRDRWLVKSSLGRKVVEAYYRCSPPLAHWIARHENARVFARFFLAPLVGLAWLVLSLG
jgi:hypothetical protein